MVCGNPVHSHGLLTNLLNRPRRERLDLTGVHLCMHAGTHGHGALFSTQSSVLTSCVALGGPRPPRRPPPVCNTPGAGIERSPSKHCGRTWSSADR